MPEVALTNLNLGMILIVKCKTKRFEILMLSSAFKYHDSREVISVFLQSKFVCQPILHTYLLLLFFFSILLIFDAVMHQMCNVVDEISMKCYHRTWCGPYRMPQVERSNYRYAIYMCNTQYLCKQDLFEVLPSIMSSFG